MHIFYHDIRRRADWLPEMAPGPSCVGTLQFGPEAISDSRSALFCECLGRICALQPSCVGTLQFGPGLMSLMQYIPDDNGHLHVHVL